MVAHRDCRYGDYCWYHHDPARHPSLRDPQWQWSKNVFEFLLPLGRERYYDPEEWGEWPPQSYAPLKTRAVDVPLPDETTYLDIIADARGAVDVALKHSSDDHSRSIVTEMSLAFAREKQPAAFFTSVQWAWPPEFDKFHFDIKPPEPTRDHGSNIMQLCSWSASNLLREVGENFWSRLIHEGYDFVCIQKGKGLTMHKACPLKTIFLDHLIRRIQ